MSDETPAGYSSPFAGEEVIIRVSAFNYVFERTPHDTLIYKGRHPATPVEDDDEKPFDTSEYR